MITTRHANGGGVAETLLSTTLLVRHQQGMLPDSGLACSGNSLPLECIIRYADSLILAPAHGWLCLLGYCRMDLQGTKTPLLLTRTPVYPSLSETGATVATSYSQLQVASPSSLIRTIDSDRKVITTKVQQRADRAMVLTGAS